MKLFKKKEPIITEPPKEEPLVKEAVIYQMIERPYNIYSQKDPMWANVKIGNGKLQMRDYGCLLTSLGMIFKEPPYMVNSILSQIGGFNEKSEVIWSKVEKAFKVRYQYHSKDPKRLCIAETNHYKPKFPQHFVLWLGDGVRIIDPLDKEPVEKESGYKMVSFRTLDKV